MDIKTLSDTFSVSPQISAHDVKAIADAGFRSILCNRPDDEETGQPSFAVISESAQQAGLEVQWVPMSNQIGMTKEVVSDMAKALETLPKPVLAYCRSGTRCSNLFMAVEHLKKSS